MKTDPKKFTPFGVKSDFKSLLLAFIEELKAIGYDDATHIGASYPTCPDIYVGHIRDTQETEYPYFWWSKLVDSKYFILETQYAEAVEFAKKAFKDCIIPDVTYKRGDRFLIDNAEYILAKGASNDLYTHVFISLKDGNMWGAPVKGECYDRISHETIKKMTSFASKVKKIEK